MLPLNVLSLSLFGMLAIDSTMENSDKEILLRIFTQRNLQDLNLICKESVCVRLISYKKNWHKIWSFFRLFLGSKGMCPQTEERA